MFHRQGDSSMCVQSLGWTLNGRPVSQHLLMDVKDPMVSSAKSRRAIPSTMATLQISAHLVVYPASESRPISDYNPI